MRTKSAPQLLTIGKMACELGEPNHRIAYIVRSRQIGEAARAGNFRLFDRAGLARVRHEINSIDARRADHA